MKEITANYSEVIQTIKNAILKSRYRAAALANRELLSLYYGIGKYISENSREGFLGTRAIETISERLQQELPGLRGFSASNMKNMRMFYEEWEQIFVNRQPAAGDLQTPSAENMAIRPPAADELQGAKNDDTIIRQIPSDELLFDTTLLCANRKISVLWNMPSAT